MFDDDPKLQLQALVKRAQVDARLKTDLLDNTMRTLHDEGVPISAGIEVKAVANSERVFYLVLPVNPTHLSELELERIAAGHIFSIAYDQFPRMVSASFSFSYDDQLIDTDLIN